MAGWRKRRARSACERSAASCGPVNAKGSEMSLRTAERRRSSTSGQERFRATAETMLDRLAIFSSVRDLSGSITDFRYEYVNHVLSAAIGVDPEQLVGRGLLEMSTDQAESGLFDDCCAVVHSRQPLSRQDVVLRGTFGLQLHVAKLGDGVLVIERDISAAKQVQALAAQLAAIVESSDDAVISMTVEGEIVSWNRGAERMYGHTSKEALGRQIALLAGPGGKAEIPAILARVCRGERIDHFDTVQQRKDGSMIDVSITTSAVTDGSGELIGTSVIAREITERKQAQAAA